MCKCENITMVIYNIDEYMIVLDIDRNYLMFYYNNEQYLSRHMDGFILTAYEPPPFILEHKKILRDESIKNLLEG